MLHKILLIEIIGTIHVGTINQNFYNISENKFLYKYKINNKTIQCAMHFDERFLTGCEM